MGDQDPDYREGLDKLQEDMANHQRRFSGEVTASANYQLAVETIERLERQDADRKPATCPVLPQAPVQPSFEGERVVDGKKYRFDKAPDPKNMFRSATEFEHQVLRHAMPRINRLLSERDTGPLGQPSWRDRTLAATYFKVKSLEARTAGMFDLADNYERAYQLDMQELLDASNASFGEWRADEPTKLIVG